MCLTITLSHHHHWPGAAGVAERVVGAESVLLPAGSSGKDGHACSQADGAIGGEARLPRGCGEMRQVRTRGTEKPRVAEMPAEAVTLKEKAQRSRSKLFPSFMLPARGQAHRHSTLRGWRTINRRGQVKNITGSMCLLKRCTNCERRAWFLPLFSPATAWEGDFSVEGCWSNALCWD